MSANHTFCIIVGAGMTGITMAAHLLRHDALQHEQFRIFDQNSDYGGVWKSNTYPGCACDVPSHSYVLRYFLKPDWSRKYAPRDEIQQYYAKLADHYNLSNSTVFNTNVIEARWNKDTLLWDVVVQDIISGKETNWTANIVVNCGGQFSRLKYADIPGRDEFRGTVFHTGNWPKDVDLKGKTVAIIGTGPSTAQVAPSIQPIVKQLYIYQRSATYVLPRNDGPTPEWKKMIFSWCYPLLWVYHVWLYMNIERSKPMWQTGTKQHAEIQAYALQHLENQVKDPVVRKKLTPTSQIGCKRLLFLDDWYPIFEKPNVELITDKPVKFTEDSIVSKPADKLDENDLQGEPVGSWSTKNEDPNTSPKERKIDVLIWGTGFNMSDQGGHFQVYGKDGVNLSALWKDSPKAYYSVGVSKFPNYFMMVGPNSANFWANLTTNVEIQAKYNAKLIKHIRAENEKIPYAVCVKQEVQDQWQEALRKETAASNTAILSPGCANYYTNGKGEAPYWNPFHGYYLAWIMRRPKLSEYVKLYGKKTQDGGETSKQPFTQTVLG